MRIKSDNTSIPPLKGKSSLKSNAKERLQKRIEQKEDKRYSRNIEIANRGKQR